MKHADFPLPSPSVNCVCVSLCVFVSALSLVCVSLCVLYWYSIGTLVCSLATVESEISEINGRHITVLCTACLTDPGQTVRYEVKSTKAFTNGVCTRSKYWSTSSRKVLNLQ